MAWFRKPAVWILAVMLGPLLAPGQTTVFAHQLQVAMTTVSFKTASGTIEVIHRFYTHDTEQVLSQLAGKQVDLLDDGVMQRQFGRYVSENFQLTDQASKPLPLSLVGVELEGDFIWVYQETAIPAKLRELTVLNTALLDTLPNQVNTVNVECGNVISTLEFSGNIRTQSADIDFGLMGSCPIK
jgi:hypothetical protein